MSLMPSKDAFRCDSFDLVSVIRQLLTHLFLRPCPVGPSAPTKLACSTFPLSHATGWDLHL